MLKYFDAIQDQPEVILDPTSPPKELRKFKKHALNKAVRYCFDENFVRGNYEVDDCGDCYVMYAQVTQLGNDYLDNHQWWRKVFSLLLKLKSAIIPMNL